MCVCVCRWADDETLLDPAATKLQTVLIALPVRHDFLEVRREDEQEEDDGIICSPTGTETNVQREANFANPASLLPIASRAAPEAAKIDKDRLKQPDGEEGETTFRIKQDGDHFATDEDAAECGITVAASKECHELVHAGDRPMAQQLYPDTDSDGQDASELAIENDRLKTTLMILNQKMKMVEDSDDINEKWKSQVQSKEGQIKILNEQIEFLQQDQEKQRSKVKELGQTNAQQESTI